MKTTSAHRAGNTASILLVDDNRHGMLARKTLLEEQGYGITIATSGEEALDAFAKGKPDLVVTDFRMPKMNGIELIVQLRALRPDLPIILLSGFVEALGLDEKSTGADVVIAKGNNEMSHVVRAVSRLLHRRAPKPKKKPPSSQLPPQSRATGA